MLQYRQRHHAVSKRPLGTPWAASNTAVDINVERALLRIAVAGDCKFDDATFPSHLRPLLSRHAPAYPPQKARQFAKLARHHHSRTSSLCQCDIGGMACDAAFDAHARDRFALQRLSPMQRGMIEYQRIAGLQFGRDAIRWREMFGNPFVRKDAGFGRRQRRCEPRTSSTEGCSRPTAVNGSHILKQGS
jgi:hypothetical protein